MILPASDSHFEWRTTPYGPMLVCLPLEPYALHGFTSRLWRLGRDRGEDGQEGQPSQQRHDGWADVAGAMGVARAQLVRMQQVHGRAVVIANPTLDPPVADVIVNEDPAVAVAVQSADCVPLLLADGRTGAVAAAHAGWRGLAARVPQTAVEAMTATLGSRAEDLLVVAGPSIGACCYEVGIDVRDRFRDAGFSADELDRWFSRSPQTIKNNPSSRAIPPTPRPDHWYFDGWSSTRDQLRAVGIESDRYFVAGLCTASHPGALCSYRRDGAPAGRLVGAIRPRPR